MSPPDTFPVAAAAVGKTIRCAIVDTETTGTDAQLDEVIDIAVIVVEVDTLGQIVGIDRAGQALRDPGMPIPAAITRLTGITDDDVRGRTIDLDRLERLLAGADVLIAHSAAFDIAFLESLMPGLAGASWACSMNDFDWLSAGFDGRKLGHLLMQTGRFNDAHRAMADVISLLHLLAHGSTTTAPFWAGCWRTRRCRRSGLRRRERRSIGDRRSKRGVIGGSTRPRVVVRGRSGRIRK